MGTLINMVRDLTPEDLEFCPTIILPATKLASKEEITLAKKQFDNDVEKLILQTKDFSEQMMVGKGLFYTHLHDIIYFHDVYGIRQGDEFGSIFLACYPKEKGSEFGLQADVILHLHLLSDLELEDQIKQFNKDQNKEIGMAYTHLYFNLDEDSFKKLVLVPTQVVTNRKSVVKANPAFKLFESNITVEDLTELKRVAKVLLKKMKITKNSREM